MNEWHLLQLGLGCVKCLELQILLLLCFVTVYMGMI